MFVIHKPVEDMHQTYWGNSNIPSDQYDLKTLIGMCDDLNNTVWGRMSKDELNPHFCELNFFIRTYHGNKILIKDGEFKFKSTLKCNGKSLNDHILLSAKEILDSIFKDASPELVCTSCVPTPLGIISTDTGFEILMQICYNECSELKIPTGYSFIPFDQCKCEGFDKLSKTLVRTKE